ncbi:single-stranded DNA-binding protein [Cryobacterium frigoriphilum]|uniref:Single-stranded DNA-binding protein n=1 Tax=Cryobacterium frigoriphilum TaxID=1259150 RepID=A0A4R9ABY8_9MICO|nr:single-stranded DNA-binding protein [Cryobacterium frigoriphilum]TFD55191.1 single-stranded DNA-binding protein [Cryobacterium frigoriphilum]
MIDSITLTGIVATDPRHIVTTDGLAITTFRLASGQRRFDRATNSWVDAGTNWYTVSTFRLLARNVARSVQKGQHVMLTGRLRLRDWKSGDRSGMTIEVAAESLGHDLNWCMTTAIRTGMTAQTPPNSGTALNPGRVVDSDSGSESDEAVDRAPEPAVPAPFGASALAPVDF